MGAAGSSRVEPSNKPLSFLLDPAEKNKGAADALVLLSLVAAAEIENAVNQPPATVISVQLRRIIR